uniref:Predicted protein n=1 Tax=Physcomitrium patens TaxID=3218 RepID=A9TMG4_PHYPA
MGETRMSHAIDARIYKDEEEVDIGYKQPTNEKNGYNQRVHFEDSSDKEMETLSHYTRKHWAKATTGELVKVGDIEEPIVALVGHGSEINLMSKDLYKKQKWPIDMEHGWAIRMETKILDNGSAYARVRSEDGRKAVQFLTVPPNHEWNRDRLREKPLPKIVEGFKDFGEVKHVAGPLPEDSKEQMREASKESSLRDPMSIGHQFTKETFEELEINSDGSLLPEEITCFKKMLAKQGRSFAFEFHEIGYLEYWKQQPTPVQILSGQVQSLRYSQSGHTEMLHSIPITGVNRKRKDQFTRRAVLFSVPFQGTLFSVKRSLKGKNGRESSDGESQFWIQALMVGANFGSKTED